VVEGISPSSAEALHEALLQLHVVFRPAMPKPRLWQIDHGATRSADAILPLDFFVVDRTILIERPGINQRAPSKADVRPIHVGARRALRLIESELPLFCVYWRASIAKARRDAFEPPADGASKTPRLGVTVCSEHELPQPFSRGLDIVVNKAHEVGVRLTGSCVSCRVESARPIVLNQPNPEWDSNRRIRPIIDNEYLVLLGRKILGR
jgi:hypothetical protein